MEPLISHLYALMAEENSGSLNADPAYRDCAQHHQQLMDQVAEVLGAEFAEKLRDAAGELNQQELEASFVWGIRLGLTLGRL